ncbi:MAG: hypothetical protein KDA81_18150, partial [Planctomycetaceae bacterium]|nr:hypothetical protein [Planctomycetaceae bacterium]
MKCVTTFAAVLELRDDRTSYQFVRQEMLKMCCCVRNVAIVLTLVIQLPRTTEVCAQNVRPTTIMRLFWQDSETAQLSYGDLVTTNRWDLKRGWVTNFPKHDPVSHRITDLQATYGVVIATIDCPHAADGQNKAGTGWIAFNSGAFEEPHGNHTHWKYTQTPQVTQQHLTPQSSATVSINETQVLIGDPIQGGFNTVSGSSLKSATTTPLSWRAGGDGKIPVVSSGNNVAFAAWGDSEGENSGRVDVVLLSKTGTDAVSHSIRLPHGGIRAVHINSGRLFVATSGGVYRINVDAFGRTSGEPILLQTAISTDGNSQPLLTERFTSQRNWVAFTAGHGAAAAFYLTDALSSSPVA